jgi:hypothetical protein
MLSPCGRVTAGEETPNDSTAALRKAAREELAMTEGDGERSDVKFTSGALGLQALNPEISVTGDFLWSYRSGDAVEQESDFLFRNLGIHLESYLDPFSRFKAAVAVNEEDVELGEAYFTRYGLLPSLNLTLGKFRQQFGVVNRWHKHGLDQVDFPLALRQIFGEGGLNQTGLSAEWTPPELASLSQELIVQVTNGDNPRVFGENADNTPSGLAHFRLYRDLTDATYAELGATALAGKNNEWSVLDATEEEDLWTSVFGVDFTLLWEPTHRMRYRNLTWRSEAFVLDKGILAPDGSGEATLNAWGAYSYLQSKISRTLVLGLRLDYYQPDSKPYAETETLSLAPLAVTGDNPNRWQVGPYLTWYQSPWVHFRFEYNHQDGDETGPSEDTIWAQCIFSAGPHKHERY